MKTPEEIDAMPEDTPNQRLQKARSRLYSTAAEAARARLQDGYDRAREATGELAAKGREQADAAREAAGQAYERGKAQAKRASSRLKDVAEKQPIALVAGAAAVGALLGSLLPKSNSKDD